MRCLVVYAHPDPESFSAALRDAAVAGLTEAGHHVDVLDLYALGFDPCLGAEELEHYFTIGHDHPTLGDHLDLLRRTEALVFVYPTWWSGLPAIMKGWLDRTFLPGVAFRLDDRTNRIRPALGGVRHLVGLTTYGSPRWSVAAVGDAGRRTINRTVRIICSKRCKRTWLGFYQLDTARESDRAEFLDRVRHELAALR